MAHAVGHIMSRADFSNELLTQDTRAAGLYGLAFDSNPEEVSDIEPGCCIQGLARAERQCLPSLQCRNTSAESFGTESGLANFGSELYFPNTAGFSPKCFLSALMRS